MWDIIVKPCGGGFTKCFLTPGLMK